MHSFTNDILEPLLDATKVDREKTILKFESASEYTSASTLPFVHSQRPATEPVSKLSNIRIRLPEGKTITADEYIKQALHNASIPEKRVKFDFSDDKYE